MKINPIAIYKNFISPDGKGNQILSQLGITNPTQTSEVPFSSADYNVRTPIPYKFVEEISLPNNLKAHCYKLANGQKIVIIPKDGTTVVQTYVNTGSLNEPEKLRGISHYIEHNLFNGSEALKDKDFFGEVNKMGASTNASTSFSVTDYYIESQLLDEGDLENKIQLHSGMLQTPKFLEEKLQKEKNIVNSEINRCLSNDSSRAESIMLKNLFNIESNVPDLVAGSTDNIDALTREDVIKYFNDNYYPANMVTVITGEVEPDTTMKLVSKYFNSNKAPNQNRYHEKLVPIDKPIRQDLISTKKEGNAEIYLGFVGPENANVNDKIYLSAVETLLLGLSNAKLKNLHNKYGADIDISAERLGTRPDDLSANIISASVTENSVEPILKDIYKVIESIKTNPPSQEEFEAIKNKMKKENDLWLQCSHALNYYAGMNFLNGTPHAISDYNNIIDSMTYNDFIYAAQKYFDLNKVSMVVVHPAGTKKQRVYENYNNSVSFTGLNKKTPLDISKVAEYKAENNFNIILQDENTDIVNYSFILDAKNITPQKAAVANVLSKMLKDGTEFKSKEEINTLFDKYAIDGNISSTDKNIILSADFPIKNSDEAINLIKEKIYSPDFSDKNFNSAVEYCKAQYLASEPSAYDDYDKEMYKGTYIEYTNKDKLKSLLNINIEDVKQLYNEILSKSQGRIVVTGPFSKHPELKQKVFDNVLSLAQVAPKDIDLQKSFMPIGKTQVYTTETKRNQAQILEGFKFKQSGNMKDDLCFNLLNTILGAGPSSRLFNDLRETRHLCYSVSSSFDTINDIGSIGLKIETTTNNLETGKNTFDNIKKSIDGFNENIERIKNEKVSEEELESAKKALKNQILSDFEINNDKNYELLNSSGTYYGLNNINMQLEMIDSITAEDILNAAKYVFNSNPIYSVAATKDALEANKDYLNNLS